MPKCFVYIMTNKYQNVLYLGATRNLRRRISEHRRGKSKSFTHKYNVDQLVYVEEVSDMEIAFEREKQLKNWHREWKMNLIRAMNPMMKDLSDDPRWNG